MNRIWIPGAGHYGHFSNRHEMRRGHPLMRYKVRKAPQWPAPVLPINWYGSLVFPMDWNDQLGDCFEAAICHGDNTLTGANGLESVFDQAAIKAQYTAASGGDNGLDEGQAMGLWKVGVAGDKQAVIYDYLDIDATDAEVMQSAIANFGGIAFTFSVPDAWISSFNADGSTIWDAPATPDENNGHAVWLNGVLANGNYHLITWGSSCQITQAGINAVEPGATVVFSPRWFNPTTGLDPSGVHYDVKAALWTQLGGAALPPWIPPTS